MADDTFTQADIDKAIKAAITEAKQEWDAETEGLKSKNRELLGKLREASGVKPEDLQAAEQRAEKAEEALAAAQKDIKAITAERDKAAKALEAESGFTQKLLIQDGLKSALITNGVKDEDFIDSLTAKFASSATVAIDGDTRKAMIGDKPLPDAIKEWAATDAGKKFVEAPHNTGGGAPGGRGGEGGKTMTKADHQKLAVSDPKAANQFVREGGKIVDEAA